MPVGGRWLWRTPPWLCSPGAASCGWACGLMGVVVPVLVAVLVPRRACGRAPPPLVAAATPPPAPQLAEQHPAADDDDRDRRHDRRRANDQVRREHPLRPETSAASTRIPTVCDTLTDSPRPSACSGRPRVPTRYAAISVLPCPGVRACPAPSAAAVRSETSRTTGVRSAERKIDGRSPVPTPPGTPATGTGLASAPGAVVRLATSMPAPSIGLASAMSSGGSVGPPRRRDQRDRGLRPTAW